MVDARPEGAHGIGRFAKEVIERLDQRLTHTKISGRQPWHLDGPILARELIKHRPRVFYSPTFHAALPRPKGVAQALTVHDLIHLEVPQERSPLRTLYLTRIVRPAVLESGLVFTVSEFSRSRIVELLDVPEESVVNVGNGCSPEFLAKDGSFRDGHPYVLFVGNNRPHKGVELLVSAIRRIPANITVKCLGLTPADVRMYAERDEEVRRYEFLSGLSDSELRVLYSGARVLAMPSSYEGFGLPALEALACGTPTVYCCDAINEVVGHHGRRVPADPDAFAAALLQLVNADPSGREELRAAARRFSWDQVADNVVAALLSRWPDLPRTPTA